MRNKISKRLKRRLAELKYMSQISEIRDDLNNPVLDLSQETRQYGEELIAKYSRQLERSYDHQMNS